MSNNKIVYSIVHKQTNCTEPIVTIFDNEKAWKDFVDYIEKSDDKKISCCDRVPIYEEFRVKN